MKKPCQTPVVATSSMTEPHHVLMRCCRLGIGENAAAAVGARSRLAHCGPTQPGMHAQRPAVQVPASEQSVALLQRNGGGGPAKTYDAHAAVNPSRLPTHVESR